MNAPKISVIVPIYNVGQYLDECIESIRRQTYTNLQIVLIDDGSTDSSGKICDEHALEDDRILVVHQENMGLVSARKKGLEVAEGEYIGFVDGDDYIDPQMYETMLHMLLRENADIVNTWALSKHRCQTAVIDMDKYQKDVFKCFIGAERRIVSAIDPHIWSKLFEKKLIRDAYALVEDDVSYGEDQVCFCAVIFMAKKICTMDNCFYHYRVREDSISHSIDFRNVRRTVRMYTNMCNILDKMDVYEELEGEMNLYFLRIMFAAIKKTHHYQIPLSRFYFPSPEKLQRKKILLYGAGKVGNDYYSQISRFTTCQIVAWVDSHPEKYDYPFVELCGLDILSTMSYDIVLIAVKNKEVCREIIKSLTDRHVPIEKIVWEKPRDIMLSSEKDDSTPKIMEGL